MTVVVLSALDLCKITSDPQHFLELISQALPHLLTDSLEKKIPLPPSVNAIHFPIIVNSYMQRVLKSYPFEAKVILLLKE